MKLKGRFAPSPTGRMHLGNICAALMSWLSVRSSDGEWVLRIEDLDPQRSRPEYARQIEDDLLWLGLEWDEGGIDGKGSRSPYIQSRRSEIYRSYLDRLRQTDLTYPCYCTRADIMATQAPHQSDGRIVYAGNCRPDHLRTDGLQPPTGDVSRKASTRLWVPDRDIVYTDRLYGRQCVNLASHCGDFILQRADGAWAYQLAVVVDDAEMGITEVVRGNDLLLSAAQQLYLYELLKLEPPQFAHIPLVCNTEGRRLSKRDSSLSMEALRATSTPEEILGRCARIMGIIEEYQPIAASDLIGLFDWSKINKAISVFV